MDKRVEKALLLAARCILVDARDKLQASLPTVSYNEIDLRKSMQASIDYYNEDIRIIEVECGLRYPDR